MELHKEIIMLENQQKLSAVPATSLSLSFCLSLDCDCDWGQHLLLIVVIFAVDLIN